MNKKHRSILAAVAVLVLSATLLVACNNYKWKSIGGGNPNEASISNGGYFVQQGNFAYYINGYFGDVTDNEWGNALKQSIVRSELNSDGTVNNATTKVVVPKVISNKSVNGGFAIFGNWIYYATPNTEQDKSGTPSTTHTDFMRTTLDAKITQRIATINSRSAEYMFTPSRVLYFLDKKISYIDFSGMKTNKEISDGKGATTGALADGVETVIWKYDASYKLGQAAEVTDYLFYTKKLTGENSFENFNEMFAVKYNGEGLKTIIGKETYLNDDEKQDLKDHPEAVHKYLDKIATVAPLEMFVEADGNATLYYSKKHVKSFTDGTAEFSASYLYMSKFNLATGELDIASEKQLTSANVSVIHPLGYEKGCFAVDNDGYYYFSGETGNDGYPSKGEQMVIKSSALLNYIYSNDGVTRIYYSEKSAPKELNSLVFNFETGAVTENAVTLLSETFKADWLKLEFIGTKFYFVNTKYNYIQYIDILTFDPSVDKAASTMIGKMTEADAKQKAEDDKKAEEDEKDKA